MAEQRKYRDEEVREIFDLATRGKAPESTSPVRDTDGMTLGEIQSIGAEVGLEPGAVARAAAALDARAAVQPRRTSFGMPIGVGRIVPLSKPLSDDQWARLVAELRTTFNARGTVTDQAGIREWSNGNLHAYVEPTGGGYRLRLTTLKSNAFALNALGGIGMACGVAMFGIMTLTGEWVHAIVASGTFTVMGLGPLAANALRLPRWADRREAQMETIARRVSEILAG